MSAPAVCVSLCPFPSDPGWGPGLSSILPQAERGLCPRCPQGMTDVPGPPAPRTLVFSLLLTLHYLPQPPWACTAPRPGRPGCGWAAGKTSEADMAAPSPYPAQCRRAGGGGLFILGLMSKARGTKSKALPKSPQMTSVTSP